MFPTAPRLWPAFWNSCAASAALHTVLLIILPCFADDNAMGDAQRISRRLNGPRVVICGSRGRRIVKDSCLRTLYQAQRSDILICRNKPPPPPSVTRLTDHPSGDFIALCILRLKLHQTRSLIDKHSCAATNVRILVFGTLMTSSSRELNGL